MKGELLIPPSAESDPEAAEIIRAWIANGGLHCSLNPLMWPGNESVGWGILVSDVIRHVADALHRDSGLDKTETIEKIRKVLNDELRSPTAETEGNFVL